MNDKDKLTVGEQWFCNKCGYVGDTQRHPGCDYNAAPMPTAGEWTTTAAKDGDCAIIHGDRQLVGVGATVTQTLEIVRKHNAALAADRENLMKLERDWHKVISEVLKCNPIPARDRADDQLEPPWEVIARIRKQLAAERGKGLRRCPACGKEYRMSEIVELEQQLAAERENFDRLLDENEDLREQLAAEREKCKLWESRYYETNEALEKLQEELTPPEREKVQTLVDALKGMLSVYEELHALYDLGDCQATVDARAALAKVGK